MVTLMQGNHTSRHLLSIFIYQKTETTLTNIKKLLVAAPFKIEENKIDVLNAVIMFFALKVVLKPHLYHSQLTLGCLVNTSGLTQAYDYFSVPNSEENTIYLWEKQLLGLFIIKFII